jgi:hypothetical protein
MIHEQPQRLQRARQDCLLLFPIAAAGAVWCYYRLPDFRHRSYCELYILFEKKVSAREKFSEGEVSES